MPKILLLCEYATLNGGERSLLAMLERLGGEFGTMAAAPPDGALADAIRLRGVEVVPFRTSDASGQRRSQESLRRELAAIIAARRPDLLHANSLAMGRLSGPVAAELQLPSICHLRDIVKVSRRAVADLNCHRRLLAVSQATKDFHVAQGLDPSKLHVLYNGVDLDEFCPRCPTGYVHRELGLPPAARLLGAIGQIGLRKGQDVLCQAVRHVRASFPNVHLLLVGERNSGKEESREFEAALRRAAEATGGHVHLLGRRDDIPQLLSELTLLVHPARQEPLGRVLLEAAASGVAIVATDVGGTREIFPPDVWGARLVPPNDPRVLTQAILEALADDGRRLALAALARRRMREAFDAGTAASALHAHYGEILGRVG